MSFCGYLQANTAVDVLIGPFIDDTDGKTAETALTLSQGDIKLSKNGQALAQKNDDTAAAHDANGYYNCELDATDTNTEGTLTLIVHESGALPVRHDFLVISQAAYASIVTAKDSGYMDVNIKAISEDTTAPDNLELMYDGTGYAGGTTKLKVDVETIKTQAVTCSAGVTVLASVGTAATSTAQTGDSYAIVNGDHGLVSIQDDIDAILADTDELQTNQGNWLTATGFSTHSAADVVTAMETNGSKLDHLWEMTEDDGGVRRLTTNSLEQAPSGGASAADIADAVWDEAIADHTTATTFGGKNQKVVPSETINDYKATGFSTHSAADVWGVATRVLTANTNLSIPSAADIADAVWDEASTGHTDAGKAGAQLWTVLDAVPNTTEFEARTLPSADYTVVTDLGTVQTGDSFAIINGDHGLVSIQDDIDALYASIITNAAGADIAADIIALKAVADLTEDIVRNKMEITDANGNVVLRADNNTDALFTVAAGVTDDLTTTIRKRLE